MKRMFIQTSVFARSWSEMGLGDEDLQELETMLLLHPDSGDVIPHLAGARKIRIALQGRGKSGGARVIYVDVVIQEKIYLLMTYAKNEQTNPTPEQARKLRYLIDAIKEE